MKKNSTIPGKRRSKKPALPSGLEHINVDAAGIDIGSEFHVVAVPTDRDPQPVRSFRCFTSDLYRMAQWLQTCGIKTVAMESTGVFWIPVFQILESQGFEVKLVNARHVKNVPGRKTDVQDCQWLQQLHTYGLLKGSFRPTNDICVLRSYLRQRDNLIRTAATHVQRMQKALTEMNLQLHKVISDITGITGSRILQAIFSGERDPLVLAKLKHYQIKSPEEDIAKALEGDYRQEHLFVLKQEWDLYHVYQQKILDCDQQIEAHLSTFEDKVNPLEKPLGPSRRTQLRPKDNEPHFDLRTHLYRITGIDFTQIQGFQVLTAQTLVSEIGLDMSRWPNEKHFCSWLGLSPDNRITGGKIKKRKTRKVVSRAAVAFRLAAQALSHSQSALGAYHQRMKYRLGAPKAITATAHKLARLYYRMMKYGQAYVDEGLEVYEQNYKERMLKNLKKKAKALGYELTVSHQLSASVT